MTPGRLLHSLAYWCSDRTRVQILEPLIADLQHQWIDSARIDGLLHGYASFWWSFAWCFACDAWSPESREFRHRAATGFLLTVVVLAAIEWWLVHGSLTAHRLAMNAAYFWWHARTMTFTLRDGVPLAICPALFHARARTNRLGPAAGVATIAVGALVTIASSGWIAPAVERWQLIQSHEKYVRSTGGGLSIEPLESWLPRYAQAKSWPQLIRGAVAGPVHRYPGYPRLVAEEDQSWHDIHWQEICDRIFVVALGVLVGLLGWILGARGPMTATATIGWLVVLSAIATEGQRGGRLLPLMAISGVLATTALRKVPLKPDTPTVQP